MASTKRELFILKMHGLLWGLNLLLDPTTASSIITSILEWKNKYFFFHVKKMQEPNKRATTNEEYLTNQKECGAPPLEWRCYSEVGSWHLDSLCESQACSQPRKPRMRDKSSTHFNTNKSAHGSVCWDKPLSWNAKWSEGCWSHWGQATWRTEHNDWLRCSVHSTALHPDLKMASH